MELLGFWSYVHADDETDMGRVQQLAHDIVANYEALSAESIRLFLDRDDIHWGDTWREGVNEALTNVAFFVAVLTPRYFRSAECRREFQFFADRAESLGVTQIIMPILYIDVPALHEDTSPDPIVEAVKSIHWEDWQELRFSERSSEQYRRGVALLAGEMARRIALVERIDVIPAVEAQEEASGQGVDFLDKAAALEEAMPRWSETLSRIQKEIEDIGAIASVGARDMNTGENRGKGFAARLTVAKRVANELLAPTDRIERLSQEFVHDLGRIDIGFRALVEQADQLSPDNTEEIDSYRTFLRTLGDLSSSANEGLGAIQGLVGAIEPVERMSKDMRPPLRRLRRALTSMVEARAITDSWLDVAGRAESRLPPPDPS